MADLDELVSAHIASQLGAPPPPLDVLRRRARRRRQRQVGGMVAGVAAAVLGVGSLAAGGGVPWTQQKDTARFATPVAPAGLLDEGLDDDGAWKVVAENDAEEGWCIRHIRTTGEGGSCGRATPPSLQEVTVFATADDGEPVTVVAGDVPQDTANVEAELSDGTGRRAVLRTVSGRPFFSFRMPAAISVERLTALDQDGRVVDQVGPLPPPISHPSPTGDADVAVLSGRLGPGVPPDGDVPGQVELVFTGEAGETVTTVTRDGRYQVTLSPGTWNVRATDGKACANGIAVTGGARHRNDLVYPTGECMDAAPPPAPPAPAPPG